MDADTPHAAATDTPADAGTLFQQARERIASLRGIGRDPQTGRATEHNTLAVKSAEHSARVWNDHEINVLLRQRVEAIRTEVGPDISLIKHSVLQTYARLEFLEETLWANLSAHGPMTGKGRTRAAASLWLAVADRKAKLATQLGMERTARAIGVAGIVADVKQGGAHVR